MKKLRIVIRRKSTMPKDVRGRFFDTRPAIWSRRRRCAKCRIRACVIPTIVKFIISPTGICQHCICWNADRH